MQVTSFEEDRRVWASKWLLLMRDLIFFVDAITSIGTITVPLFMKKKSFNLY